MVQSTPEPNMSGSDSGSDVYEFAADENDPAAEKDQSDEDEIYAACHYQNICALCNLCLICGGAAGNCSCARIPGSPELMMGIYKDVAVLGTSVSAFLQHRRCPLPKLRPGHYLPKVKLCSYKANGCLKKFSNWKETTLGKAAMQSPVPDASTSQVLPMTPQTREKPVKSQKAPKKAKVSNSKAIIVLDPEGDVENDAPPIETTEIKKERTVQMSVSLHSPVNTKGVSTAIESAKVVITDVKSFEEVWAHLEKSLVGWEPLLWDRTKLYYIEAVPKSPVFVMRNWNQFACFLELFHSNSQAKKPTLVIRRDREKSSGSTDAGKNDASQSALDHAGTMLASHKRLTEAHRNKCLVNPDGCLHDIIEGMLVHLHLTVPMKAAWLVQITAGTPGVDFLNPPRSLDSFNLENYKPEQSDRLKWAKDNGNQGALQRSNVSSGNAMNALQRDKQPLPSAKVATAIVPQTIRFYGREADTSISCITGKLSFEQSDTIASMLTKAGFQIGSAMEPLDAWEIGTDSDRQFLFDGNLKATLTREHTDILIKPPDAPPSQRKFH